MRKTVSLWFFVTSLAVLLLVFASVNMGIFSSIQEMKQNNSDATMQLSDLKLEQEELKRTKDLVGQDAYVEQEARDHLGFMMKDELRLVIVFPEDTENPSP
ncbi:MAG: hypothetical protein E7319_02645 [Clostridiales bacterium]|nr:hypothetical protein [Clostridiales bacterium]